MKDQFGNYVVQRLFEDGDESLKVFIYQGVIGTPSQVALVLKDHYGIPKAIPSIFYERNEIIQRKGRHVFGLMENYFKKPKEERNFRGKSKKDKNKRGNIKKQQPVPSFNQVPGVWGVPNPWGFSGFSERSKSPVKPSVVPLGFGSNQIAPRTMFMPYIFPTIGIQNASFGGYSFAQMGNEEQMNASGYYQSETQSWNESNDTGAWKPSRNTGYYNSKSNQSGFGQQRQGSSRNNQRGKYHSKPYQRRPGDNQSGDGGSYQERKPRETGPRF